MKKSVYFLLIAAAVLIFINLGMQTLWTQEHRWADITYGMIVRHNYLHPYLAMHPYYDKPLLSYWLILLVSKVIGLNTWAVRLPSALAGFLAVWSMYKIGERMQKPELGEYAAWMLITTYYFLFWCRVGNTDMLNVGGTLFAIFWYLKYRDQPKFWNMSIFFIVMALTSLCKGLLGFILPVIFIIPDLFYEWRIVKYLKWNLILSVIPAIIIYVLPFYLSSHFHDVHYGESGLYEVFRENFVRYFHAFDHKGPIYTYFKYLPLYIFPWIFFFIPAFILNITEWKTLNKSSKWIFWAFAIAFVFFTASSSRRDYYTLSLVPFAILLTADWVVRARQARAVAKWVIAVFLVLMFLFYVIIKPLSFMGGGIREFAKDLKVQATQIQPWQDWKLVLLDSRSSVHFYLRVSPYNITHGIQGGHRKDQTTASLLKSWPILKAHPKNVIFVTRRLYEPLLTPVLKGYKVVNTPLTNGERWLHKPDLSDPVAYIPIEGKVKHETQGHNAN